MKLSRRLDRLETPVREAWEEAWADFSTACDDCLPAGILERVSGLEGRSASFNTACEAEVKRLDTWGLDAWCHTWELPDLDGRKYHLTPADVPLPPEEPPGALEGLTQRLQDDGVKGDAAAILVFALCLARAIRACRG